jgi:methionine-rich copper-binding protein CopC
MQTPYHRPLALAATAAALLFMLLAPIGASAHAALDASEPADQATVPGPFAGPITLTFSEALQAGSHAELLNAGGTKVADAAVNAANQTLMVFTLASPLAPGAYSIQWTSVAADKDVARGTLSLTVAQPTPAPATPTPAPTAGPTAAATAAGPATATPSAAVTVAPAATASAAATPAGGAGSNASSSGSDVIIPIIAVVVLIGVVATVLLRRKPAA